MRPVIKCRACGREKQHHAFGLCRTCYGRKRFEQNSSKSKFPYYRGKGEFCSVGYLQRKYRVSRGTIDRWIEQGFIESLEGTKSRRLFRRKKTEKIIEQEVLPKFHRIREGTRNIPKEQIEELYLEKRLSRQETARALKTSAGTIDRKLKKFGITTRNLSEASGFRKEINRGFFKEWNPGMAWVLGLLLTDGNLLDESNRISLSLTDRDITEKVKKLLKSEHPIKLRLPDDEVRKIQYLLCFYDPLMADDLRRLNLVPNKSLIIEMPEVPRKMLRHFLRGVWDGDGCTSLIKTSKVIIASITSGSYNFLKRIEEELFKIGFPHAPITKRKPRSPRHNFIYTLIYAKAATHTLFRYLYKGVLSGLYSERKYKKWKRLVEQRPMTDRSWKYTNMTREQAQAIIDSIR